MAEVAIIIASINLSIILSNIQDWSFSFVIWTLCGI